jgi:sugar phosphate isomerase/epimerase
MRADQIALQLYTVRAPLAVDFGGTLARVAEAGYRAVELAGFGEHTAADVRAMLDVNGLRVSSAHVSLTAVRDDVDGVIDGLLAVGSPWAIVPAVPEEDRVAERLVEIAGELDGYARRFASAGLRFGYHNHAFEFTERLADGTTAFDAMVAATTPGLVSFELDLFWVAVGGADPAGTLRTHGDRVALVHLKDAKRGALVAGQDVPFGDGDLDWAEILAAARDAGVEWYVTELDTPDPADPVASAERALLNAERCAC